MLLDKVQFKDDARIQVVAALDEFPGHAETGDFEPQAVPVNQVRDAMDKLQLFGRQMLSHSPKCSIRFRTCQTGEEKQMQQKYSLC